MGKWLGVIQRDVYISPGFEKVLHSTARSVGLEYVLLELISRSILYVLPPADAVTVDGARARMSFNYVAAEREQRAAATAEISSSAAATVKIARACHGLVLVGRPRVGPGRPARPINFLFDGPRPSPAHQIFIGWATARPGLSILLRMGHGPAGPSHFQTPGRHFL